VFNLKQQNGIFLLVLVILFGFIRKSVNVFKLKVTYKTEQEILKEYSVINPKEVQKIAINTASLVQLSEIIYFNYELAREIVEYRELHEGIKTFEELAKIESFPAYKIDRIKLYLTIN